MIRINVHEAKTHLSRYLEAVGEGETILLCKRNIPIAEIRPLAKKGHKPRTMGLAKGLFSVPASFFEDLPEAALAAFHGEDD